MTMASPKEKRILKIEALAVTKVISPKLCGTKLLVNKGVKTKGPIP
jgi:hypothetical protein